MSRWFLGLLLSVVTAGLAIAVDDGTLSLGSRKQLFLDDYVVESLAGVSPKLNQPTKHPHNPLIRMTPIGDQSWDAGVIPTGFASVIYDDDEHIFKMWYGVIVITHAGKTPENRTKFSAPGDEAAMLAYATSQDGLTWHKPALGLVNFRVGLLNNLSN